MFHIGQEHSESAAGCIRLRVGAAPVLARPATPMAVRESSESRVEVLSLPLTVRQIVQDFLSYR